MKAQVGAFVPAAESRSAEPPPRLLFVGVVGDPCADRIVADMAQLGAICAVVAPANAFAARTRFVQRVFAMPDWRWRPMRALSLAHRLEEIVETWRPELILPIDDLSSLTLRDARLFANASPHLRKLLASSLGDPRNFDVASSRRSMMQLARSIGVRTPREADAGSLSQARAAADAFGYPVVLKRDLSCGGGGVAIVKEERELESAFVSLYWRARAKRLASWFPGYRSGGAPYLTCQEFIPGELAYRVAACVNGRELEGMDFAVINRGPFDTGPSIYIKGIEHAEMARSSRRMIAAMSISGLVSLDYMLSPRGDAYLIEMNPRPVHTGHLGALFGRDVHVAALRGRAVASPSRQRASAPETIALFPRALDQQPDSAYLTPGSNVYHDIPWDDPVSLDNYRLWLEARHPAMRPVLGGRLGSGADSAHESLASVE
jgi:hypothetical protein